eukprot:scaffold539768_cov48-Prasinocladus_malaysianus.AAC.1
MAGPHHSTLALNLYGWIQTSGSQWIWTRTRTVLASYLPRIMQRVDGPVVRHQPAQLARRDRLTDDPI